MRRSCCAKQWQKAQKLLLPFCVHLFECSTQGIAAKTTPKLFNNFRQKRLPVPPKPFCRHLPKHLYHRLAQLR